MTTEQVQLRRGTAAQIAAFTPAQGELVADTTNNRLVLGDGATAGGFAAPKLAEVLTNARTTVNDAAYTALATDRTIAYTALTAARIVSLPASSSFPTGTRLLVVDESGSCSATKTITLSANGSDKIDGASSAVINTAYGYCSIESNGSGKWTVIDVATTLVATDGAVVSVSGGTVTIGGPGGMVNKFRNATMDVWQRGTSGTVTTSGSYTADGWIVLPTGASVPWQQNGGRLLTKNSLQVTGASSVTDVKIKQRIESLIAAAFCSQTVTVQAQVCNVTGGSITPTLTVNRPGAQDNYGSVTADVNAVNLQACPNGIWTLVSYTFTANAASYNGLEIVFDFGNNFGANTKALLIAELDIRVTPGAAAGLNSNPPPPELRPIGIELPFCSRYLQTSYNLGTAPGTAVGAGSNGIVYSAPGTGGSWVAAYLLSTPMRMAPAIVVYDGAGASGKNSYYVSSWNNGGSTGTTTANQKGLSVNCVGSGSVSYFGFDFTANAEL
jgi:hypothetical protein